MQQRERSHEQGLVLTYRILCPPGLWRSGIEGCNDGYSHIGVDVAKTDMPSQVVLGMVSWIFPRFAIHRQHPQTPLNELPDCIQRRDRQRLSVLALGKRLIGECTELRLRYAPKAGE